MAIKAESKGFTLVEVIVAMVIIGILAAISVPNFISWLPNMRLKAAASDLYSHMQKAKMEAIKSNSDVVVAFDVLTNSYQIFVDDGGTTGTAADDIRNGDERIVATVVLPDGVVIDSVNFSLGSTAPGFTAKGLPLKNRIGNVRFGNVNNQLYELRLRISGGLILERI